MRFLIVVLAALFSACAPSPPVPITDKSAQDIRKKTLEWLHEVPSVFVWCPTYVEDPKSFARDFQFDFNGWIERGKAIDGSELALIRMLDERDRDVDLERVAFALGEIGGSDCLRALIECLNRDDSSLQTKAVEALGKLRDARAVEALATRLTFVAEKNEGVQSEIVRALAMIGDEAAINYLKRAVKEGNHLVADEAQEQLDDLHNAAVRTPHKDGAPKNN